MRGAAEEVLNEIDLLKISDHKGGALSFGQTRLLEIARVLFAGAKILLLDEPFANVNFVIVNKIIKMLENFKSKGGTVLMIEHSLEHYYHILDYIFEIRDRHIIKYDLSVMPPDDLQKLRIFTQVGFL
jgi:ABC-type branched-subunit amino acid transport system ATPase component